MTVRERLCQESNAQRWAEAGGVVIVADVAEPGIVISPDGTRCAVLPYDCVGKRAEYILGGLIFEMFAAGQNPIKSISRPVHGFASRQLARHYSPAMTILMRRFYEPRRKEAEYAMVTLYALENATELLPDWVTPTENKKYIAADLEIENMQEELLHVNVLYVRLKTTDGYLYTPRSSYIDPALHFGSLAQGEKLRGWATFEIPVDSSPTAIIYQFERLYETERVTFDLDYRSVA